jgi:hypothetical protein
MGQQTINDGETGLSVRNKLNANFTELYTGKDSVTVNAYADLPDPTTVPQQKYWVLTSTGVYLINRRNAGAYYSDGAVWTWLGNNPTTADQIGNVPAGSIAATDVQGALNELDTFANQLTGWGSYTHTGAAQTLSAGVKVTLTNNAGTIIDSQKPDDIAAFYSGGLVAGRNGESAIIGVNIVFTPSSALASTLYMAVDIGGSIGEIEPDDFSVLKGSGVAHRINYTKAPYMGATFAANGGAIKVMSDGPGEITGTTYLIHRLHKV